MIIVVVIIVDLLTIFWFQKYLSENSQNLIILLVSHDKYYYFYYYYYNYNYSYTFFDYLIIYTILIITDTLWNLFVQMLRKLKMNQ